MLIVDDEPFAVATCESLFSDEYDVKTAKSAEEALALIGVHHFDIALVDYRMPGLNGLAVIRALAEKNPKGLRYLVTATELTEQIGSDAAPFVYVAKPFEPEDMIERVARDLKARNAK